MPKPTPLRRYRESKGLTPAAFADHLGIPEPTLRSLENGWRPITAERALHIEKRTDGELTRGELRPDLFGDIKPKRRRAEAAA